MRTVDDLPLLTINDRSSDHRGEMDRDPLGFLGRIAREQGDVCAIKLLKRIVFVNSPELLHELLVEKARSFEKSPVIRGLLRPLAGDGLFTAKNDHWRPHRKLMAPLFQPAALARYADDMTDCALRGTAGWRDGDEVPIARETTRITMAVAGRTLFHAETFDEADELGAALTTALAWVDRQSTSAAYLAQIVAGNYLKQWSPHLPTPVGNAFERAAAWLEVPFAYSLPLPGREARDLREAAHLLDARMQRLIDERRAAAAAGAPRKPDLLTTLLEARYDDGRPLPDKQLRDEVITLFVAGHETTAAALAWALSFLARDPALLARVHAEVDALSGRVPGMADLPSLPLTLRVFKEALRYYPPVFALARQAIEDTSIGDITIPRGAVALFSAYSLHHRESLWPDPGRFDPDRFLPEAEAARSRNAFIPFGLGPRSCIGNHFALIEGPLVLAVLLQRADFELLADPIPAPQATLRPKGGLPMRVKLRKPPTAAVAAN